MKRQILTFWVLLAVLPIGAQCWQYVDPRIGSVGVGRTFPGPSMPFGMVKPGPDCGVLPNAGWAPMPEAVSGFSQTHVSGTGGGQKYGNILLQPLIISHGLTRIDTDGDGTDTEGTRMGHGLTRIGTEEEEDGWTRMDTEQRRVTETVELGYYSTTYENGIRTEITTAERCAFYKFHYPINNKQYPINDKQYPINSEQYPASNGLLVDATHFLGKDTVPDLRERQQFVGAEVEVVDDHNVRGFSRVRGGWNNGEAYTVYFWLTTDKPFEAHNLQSSSLNFQSSTWLCRLACPRIFNLLFSDSLVNVKVGISYVSERQARRNIPSHDFDRQLTLLREAWEQQLQKVQIIAAVPEASALGPSPATDREKRMFYTALYHTMLMPVDKTGENPRWSYGMAATELTRNGHGWDTDELRNGHGWDTDGTRMNCGTNTDGSRIYYDDFYAIWDTYRTSSPLLTILDPQREADIVNALLNIYVREGYLPDARSGDCNGRTQGGSNADVVIADAFVKGLTGIDYELALQAMLKDGEADPGADHEKHGRGGLNEYLRQGYVPYSIDRAGTRTVEYAFCDYCISVVAKGLGRDDIAQRYEQRSANWHNLWRGDYAYDGMTGYIMPRDADGQWLDSVVWGRSAVFRPKIPYTPVTKVAPWYIPWWSTFFYEATSQEYSLSVPHDVEGLIEACGGKEAFRQRLDRFFERGYYNVQNEPSFLTPCLYHWIGRPDLSTQRIHQIINDHYSDRPDGLPGNDDSGAMSSWYAFHAMGLYPNAGHDYYLLNVPLLSEYTLHLPNGKRLHVRRTGKGMGFGRVLLNGHCLDDARLCHQDLLAGGELVFECKELKGERRSNQKLEVNSLEASASAFEVTKLSTSNSSLLPLTTSNSFLQISFTLNRQFRTWPLSYCWQGDTLSVVCKQTEYRIPRRIVDEGDSFCWLSPQTDGTVHRKADGTFAFISRKALQQLLDTGAFTYDNITWRLQSQAATEAVVMADIDRTIMRISLTGELPLVLEMSGNPLGIDWKIKDN